MEEIWKDVVGYPGYQVSNLGRVKSFKHDRINGKISTGFPHWGCRRIYLVGLGETYIHQLVAMTFFADWTPADKVKHINNDKCDNRLENLLHIMHDNSDLNGEVWRDVVGYEGLCKVSNLGRVKSSKDDRILVLNKSTEYITFNLRSKSYRLHRALAEAFIPNPENKLEVNHINADKFDNRLENLEWCTHLENMQHASRYGLRTHPRRLTCKYDLNGNLLKTYTSLNDAAIENNILAGGISNCALGKRPTGGGFIWKYVYLEPECLR